MKQHVVFSFLLILTLGSYRSSDAQESARELYLEGREHLIDERFEEALAQFRRVVSDFRASEEADDAQYYVGYCLAELERVEEALEAYAILLDRWPDSVRVERARAQRAELLARRRGEDANDDLFREVFDGSSSWALKRDTAFALARKGNFTAHDILEEAMERESSSRQIELARILAPWASDPAARRILIMGLSAGRSSSVKLRALQSLEDVASHEDVAVALGRLLTNGSSSSVKQKTVVILSTRLDAPGVRQALSGALDGDNSSSVQMLACRSLTGHLLDPEVRPSVIRVFQGSSSSSVRLQCLTSLESQVNDLAAADVLRAALANKSSSSSVRLKALQLASISQASAVRAVADMGLKRGNSTSVQLQAVRALTSGKDDDRAAEALDGLFRQSGASTSVLLAAIGALQHHMGTPAGPSALGRALSSKNSTSVQLRALKLAADHLDEVEVKNAVLTVLEESGASTSVKLEAISMMHSRIDEAEVRRIVGAALHTSNSTSVLLKAVEALGDAADEADSRQALARVLDSEYSTSVVLASMRALASHIEGDSSVREAFIRTMESRKMSSTARVFAGERLFEGADAATKARIADAMEDVVLRARRSGRGRGNRDVIEDALDLLELIDADRAETLRARSRASRKAPRGAVYAASPQPISRLFPAM